MSKTRFRILLPLVLFLVVLFCFDRTCGIYSIVSGIFHPQEETAFVKFFPFDDSDSLKEWSEKILKGRVEYTIESSEGSSYVHAVSSGSCSAMHYEIKLDAGRRPFLSWKWRVGGFPGGVSKDDLSIKARDDFAARIYVIFPALFFANSKVLEYVWAKDLPAGTIGSSPYSDNIKIVVLRTGGAAEWASEERDIYKDYLEAFSEKPELMIGALAFMCDSDSTKTKAEAFFDDIKIFYKR